MTDRINSIVVVLEKDYRDDDVEPILDSIRMTKGVLSVTSNVSDHVSHMAEERARHELGQKLIKIVYPKL